MKNRELKLAVLIDADNAQAKAFRSVMTEVDNYGDANIKRAYGDWTTTYLRGWKSILNKYAISPIQQFSYTKGKNSTDSSMIIDAMDLLYSKNLDGFCLITSDSDFTRLASRIRESGLKVFGFGDHRTPQAFRSACNKFTEIDIANDQESQHKTIKSNDQISQYEIIKGDVSCNQFKLLITSIIDGLSAEYGVARLSAVGVKIADRCPSFNLNDYGVKKLSSLMNALDYIDIFFDDNAAQPQNYLCVRLASKKSSSICCDNKVTQQELKKIIEKSIMDLSGDLNKARLSKVGNYMHKLSPNFTIRDFGHKTLTSLMNSLSYVDVWVQDVDAARYISLRQ